MPLIWFFLRTSWLTLTIATVIGAISGLCSTLLLAIVNESINSNTATTNQAVMNFAGLLGLVAVTGVLSQYLLVNLSQAAIYNLRLRLSHWILACPLRRLEDLGANRLLATLTEDVDAISDSVLLIPLMCVDLAIVVGCLFYLGSLSWSVLLFTLAMMIGVTLSVKVFFARSEALMKLARAEQDNLFQHFRTMIDGIKELKLHTDRRNAFLQDELEASASLWRHYNVTSTTILGFSMSLSQVVFFGMIGLLVFVLPRFVSIDRTILSGYVLVIIYLTAPLKRIMAILPELGKASVALQQVEALKLSLRDNLEISSANRANKLSFNKKLQLKQLTHTYYREYQDSQFSIGPIDLTIVPGELIFIVGGNGSGKSTLAKLVAGLYTPESGEICVDGKPITEQNREAYRQLFSTVFSDFHLFDRFLGIDAHDLDTKAKKYLNLLQLDHKVRVDGDRLSTLALSQGQRKRLALLTAYLEDREVYLFDEWASDQDPYFKDIFYTQLLPDLKRQGKTVLVISHDDRYFDCADRVIKLDYGALALQQKAYC